MDTELEWLETSDGFTISFPNGYVSIQRGSWLIRGCINGVTLTGVRSTAEEALRASEEQIRRRVTSLTFQCLKRPSDNRPVTTHQRRD